MSEQGGITQTCGVCSEKVHTPAADWIIDGQRLGGILDLDAAARAFEDHYRTAHPDLPVPERML